MNRRVVVAAAALSLWVALAPASSHAAVIAQWTFNSPGVDNDPTSGTSSPETGAGTLSPVGGVSHTGFAQGSGNDNSPTVGNNNNSSYQTQNYPPFDAGDKTAGIEIAVDTTGHRDIALSFEHWHATGASASFRIQYSSDGVTFTDASGYTATSDNAFLLRGDDFGAIAALDDNPDARFRVVAEFQGNFYSGVGGNYLSNARNRFDLVTVTGTPIPEPATVAVLLPLLGLALRRRRWC